MRLLRNPTLKAATQATFFQRLVAFTFMLLLVSTVLFWPNIRDGVGEASAQPQDNNYQPFQCGQAGSTAPQTRRSNLELRGAADSIPGGRAYPCISGVQWRLVMGCVRCGASDSDTGNGAVAIINNAYAATGQGLSFAGTGSASGLTRVSIQALRFCAGVNNPVGGSWGCRKAVSGLQLYANSGTSQSHDIKNDYQLNIAPATAMTVGGPGMMADIWGLPNSSFMVPSSQITLGNTGCGFVGGSTSTNACTVTLSQFSGTLAQALAGGDTLSLLGVDLTFYYLITHSPTVTNPYTEGATSNSVILPNTRIFVGNGS